MLSAKNIHKSFGSTEILKGVDLNIEPGQITVLVGPSGSGKTTLLRALSMIDYPTSGSLAIDGTTYNFPLPKDESGEDVLITPPWPKMTVVFQQLFLWPHMTLRENILMPALNLHPREQIEKELDELIELFQMGHFIDNYPNEASLGQKQRIAIARAILLHPSYLFMDEITSALDVRQVAKILELLPVLKKRGIGILIITHLINFAKRAADQIIFMDQGKILEAGSPKILDQPKTDALKDFLSMVEAAS